MRNDKNRVLLPVLAALLLTGSGACEYDPPPEIKLTIPKAGGSILLDGTLEIRFTEPIDPSTLSVTLYPRELDADWELKPDCDDVDHDDCVEAVAGPCTVDTDCADAVLTLLEGNDGFRFAPASPLAIGGFVLRVASGLTDPDGNDYTLPQDLSFFATPTGERRPTTFESGVVMTWMTLDKPFPFDLQVYWRLDIDPETGDFYGGGCDGDAKDPDTVEQADYEYTEWYPAPYEMNGFHVIYTGNVQDVDVKVEGGDSKPGWYLATNPFYILNLALPGYIEVIDGTIDMSIVWNDEMQRHEVIDGTLQAREIYLLSPDAKPTKEVSAKVYGYRLYPEEMAAQAAERGNQTTWDLCLSDEPDTYFPDP